MCVKKIANWGLKIFRIKFKDNYKVSPTFTILTIIVKRLKTLGSVGAYWRNLGCYIGSRRISGWAFQGCNRSVIKLKIEIGNWIIAGFNFLFCITL